MLTAYNLKTGEPVAIGDTVTNFRGETGSLSHLTRPYNEGRDGKVITSPHGREVHARAWGLRVEYTDTCEPIANPVHTDPFAGIPNADDGLNRGTQVATITITVDVTVPAGSSPESEAQDLATHVRRAARFLIEDVAAEVAHVIQVGA